MEELNIEEKIDYIYRKTKKNERNRVISFIIKLLAVCFILWFFTYFYHFWYKMMLDKINNGIKINLKENSKNILDKKDDIIKKAKDIYKNTKKKETEY